MNNEQRWKQRFQNFEKAYVVLRRRMDEYETHPQEEAYQMALIQGFEMAYELSWKTLRDFLKNKGVDVSPYPKDVIRHASQSTLIAQPETWMKTVEIRNQTSHTYDEALIAKVTAHIADEFYPAITTLYQTLKAAL